MDTLQKHTTTQSTKNEIITSRCGITHTNGRIRPPKNIGKNR